jgi:hypothetical protein
MSRRAAPDLDVNEPPTKRSRISDISPNGEPPSRDPSRDEVAESEEDREQLDEAPVIEDVRASDLYLDTVSIAFGLYPLCLRTP